MVGGSDIHLASVVEEKSLTVVKPETPPETDRPLKISHRSFCAPRIIRIRGEFLIAPTKTVLTTSNLNPRNSKRFSPFKTKRFSMFYFIPARDSFQVPSLLIGYLHEFAH